MRDNLMIYNVYYLNQGLWTCVYLGVISDHLIYVIFNIELRNIALAKVVSCFNGPVNADIHEGQ